jgi:hypothetical protein
MSINYGHPELRDNHMARRADQGPVARPHSEAPSQLAESSEPNALQPVEHTEPIKRPAGRPKGSLGRRHLEANEIVAKVGVDPLEFLLRVVRNRRIPIDQRIRAAQAACIHVHPKLQSSKVESTIDHRVGYTQIQMLAADPILAEAMEAIAFKLASIKAPTRETLEAIPEHALLPEPVESGEDDLLFGPEKP